MIPGKDYIGVGVGAIIINDQGKILLSRRGKKAKNERGKWEIPGGAVDFGETFEQALKREVKEEIDVEIEVIQLIQSSDHLIPEEHQHWVASAYLCKILSGEPTIKEPEKCDELKWFSFEEAAQLPLAIVTVKDIAIMKKLGKERVLKIIHGVDRIELPFA